MLSMMIMIPLRIRLMMDQYTEMNHKTIVMSKAKYQMIEGNRNTTKEISQVKEFILNPNLTW